MFKSLSEASASLPSRSLYWSFVVTSVIRLCAYKIAMLTTIKVTFVQEIEIHWERTVCVLTIRSKRLLSVLNQQWKPLFWISSENRCEIFTACLPENYYHRMCCYLLDEFASQCKLKIDQNSDDTDKPGIRLMVKEVGQITGLLAWLDSICATVITNIVGLTLRWAYISAAWPK